MIDPRFANAGAVPLVPGYGAQQIPAQYQQQHHHRHHRHHKHKVRNDASPISLDESIHKVDHNQPHYFQQNGGGVPLNSGYGVPYGATAYETGTPYGATSFYPQQQYGTVNIGYGNQYQGVSYGQGQFGSGPAGPPVKHHRRHRHHHHHHTAEAANTNAAAQQAQAVPEQLIGQRSSSVLEHEQQPQEPSPVPPVEGEQGTKHRHHRRHHHHHHHHHSGEHSFEQTHQSGQTVHHTAAGADGYGHINDELIFIERGDHSPHRQEPPPGYEYKGKIEVQNIDKEHHTHSQGQASVAPSTFVPPPPPPASTAGPCPPGWQQMVLSAGGSFGPCPPGGLPYTGQLIGGGAAVQPGIGGFGIGGGFSNFGTSGSLPPNCQIVADYIFGSNSGGVISSGGGGFTTGYQQTGGTSFGEQVQTQQTEAHVSGRATIIEVWQKRAKSETQEQTSSLTPTEVPSFDFERFRNEILAAVERAVARGPVETPWTGRDGGTQTQIHPTETRIETERRHESTGEVRVIVQPIQPVFYMPQQTGGTTAPQIGPAPSIQQQSGAPNVIYVPRNVYVPVIKPVFVPRERVIIRPQIIHVARPVLVDRPVPVTQRPIIIDRERPIPVPVRGGGQAAAQGGGSKIVREEYVYRDNLPVAYGGRCAEFAGGVNYGYMPSQQEHQYASSSTHEAGNIYQTQGQAVNVNVPNQFQQSQTSSYVEVQQGGGGGCGGSGIGSYHGSYSNLAEGNNPRVGNDIQFDQEVFQQTFQQSAQIAGAPTQVSTQIEVLDTAVNPFWQKTDQPALMRRYGRPAFEIVHKSQEVEQQMYNELRQRTSSGGLIRSASTVSYGSGSGVGTVDGGIAQY